MSTVHNTTGGAWDADTVKGYIRPHLATLAAEWNIELTGKIRDGWMECRAFDRVDNVPSAAIHQETLVYKDLGRGPEKAISIFDLAIQVGAYRDFPSAVNGLGERFNAPSKYPRVLHPPDYPSKPKRRKSRASYATFEDARAGEGTSWAGNVVATFHYGPNFKRVRYQGGKDGKRKFVPFHIDESGRWVASKPEGLLPLYNRAELEAREAARVYFLEGEKCTDLVANLGEIATTSPLGSSSTLGVDFAPLAGREVVILPDHDEAGEKFASKLVETLAKLEPRPRLRVLRLPGLQDAEDVEQWLQRLPDGIEDAGAELNRLADAAPNPLMREYATLADAKRLLGDTTWFWDQWIPNGNLSLVAAPAGVGKTRFLADLCRIIYLGLPTMPDGSPNPHPKGTRSLWLMYDRNWQMTAQVLESFGLPLEAIILPSLKDSPLYLPEWDDPRVFDDLRQQVEDQKPGLMVIDTITYATTKNTAKAEEAKLAFDAVIQVAADTGIPVVGAAHLNKEGSVLNRRLVERARSVIHLSAPDPDGQPHRRKLWVEKSAVLKPPALGITCRDSGNEYDFNPPEEVEPEQRKRGPAPAKSMKAAEWLVAQLAFGPTKVKALVDAAQFDGILAKPTAEKPKTSLSPLYNAKDRIPAIKPGWSVSELVVDGRKVWDLVAPGSEGSDPNGADEDPDLDGWPAPYTPPIGFVPTTCIACGKPVKAGECLVAVGSDGNPWVECWECNGNQIG